MSQGDRGIVPYVHSDFMKHTQPRPPTHPHPQVSQGDRSIMRYVHSDFSGTQATTSYRPLPRDT